MLKTKIAAPRGWEALPLEKDDIRYDPNSQEVTLKREKLDAFVKYTQALVERLEAAEDERDVARYRARKAEKTTDVVRALADVVADSTAAVRKWLSSSGNSLFELSKRTGIPYATCYRIVNERFGAPNLEFGPLEKMLEAISRGLGMVQSAAEPHPQFQHVLLGLPQGQEEAPLTSPWEAKGSEVAAVFAGAELEDKAKEMEADLIVLDASMPKLDKNLERLRKYAQRNKAMVVLTGEIGGTNSALARSVSTEERRGEQQSSANETTEA